VAESVEITKFPGSLVESPTKENDPGSAYVKFSILNSDASSPIKVIALYVPNGFSIEDSANFGSMNFGTIDAISQFGKTLNTGTEGARAQINGASDGEINMITAAIMQSSGGSGLAVDTLLRQSAQSKIALNNKTVATFEDMGIRQFSFTFKLVPSSASDSRTISYIENTFRKNMYPEKGSNLGFSLKYPPEIKVEFYRGAKRYKFMPKLANCYLTGLSPSYNENSNMFHKDGAPTDTTIQLSFQEVRQLTRGDLYEGDDPTLQKDESE